MHKRQPRRAHSHAPLHQKTSMINKKSLHTASKTHTVHSKRNKIPKKDILHSHTDSTQVSMSSQSPMKNMIYSQSNMIQSSSSFFRSYSTQNRPISHINRAPNSHKSSFLRSFTSTVPEMIDRPHSVANLIKTKYVAPTSTVVQGQTVKAAYTTKYDATAPGLHVMFVTKSQFDAGSDKLGEVSSDVDWSASSAILKAQNFDGKASSSAIIVNKEGKPVLVMGLGDLDKKKITASSFRGLVKAATVKAKSHKHDDIVIVLPSVEVSDIDQVPVGYGLGIKGKTVGHNTQTPLTSDAVVTESIREVIYNNYLFDLFLKDETVKEKNHLLRNITIVGNNDNVLPTTIHNAIHTAESETLEREIGSLRANVASTVYMKEQCEHLVAAHSDVLKLKILDKDALAEAGYNLILSVAAGSVTPPFIVGMEYTPPNFTENDTTPPPVALVGKTLTFDTGGLDLKPAASMFDMHIDKLGGCSTLATMRALALTRPQTQRKIICILTIVQNDISATATQPRTIIQSHKGSVSVDNTDAEGRLALADAVHFAQSEYKAGKVMTIATLTGAIMIALGYEMTGVFTNNKLISRDLQDIGEKYNDLFWPMPILPKNHEMIKGFDCDITNISRERFMGSSVAAAFLEKYIEEGVEFTHLDIAGSSCNSKGEPNAATVRSLVEYFSKHH